MIWKDYSDLSGSHAFLSPSRYHWLNYSDEKLIESFKNHKRAALGTRLHFIASELIKYAIRQRDTRDSFNAFVNDAIGFRMSPEVVLYYSPNCYGTADAISFEDGVLRIHDLKTGVTPGSLKQLLIYAALFCLDYRVEPKDLKAVHLRIYQGGETVEFNPDPADVFEVTRRIVQADKLLKEADEMAVL